MSLLNTENIRQSLLEGGIPVVALLLHKVAHMESDSWEWNKNNVD